MFILRLVVFSLIFLFLLPSPVPPHIVPFEAEEQVFAGESVQLTCHVSKGDAPLTITWSFHGQELSTHQGITTTKIGHRTSLLTISAATFGHSGEYSCHATNLAGLAVHSATVNVHGIPRNPFATLASTARCTLASVINLAFWINSTAIHRTLRGGRVGVRRRVSPAQLSCIKG